MTRSLNHNQFLPEHLPGEAPIPEGHDRYFHQTHPDNVPSIREHGLLWDKGRGVEGPKGVWISNTPFYGDAHDMATVELHLPHHPQRGRIASIGEVKPENSVASHEPWHQKARYMEENEDVKQNVLSGQHDDLQDYPEYGPAIDYIKRKYSS